MSPQESAPQFTLPYPLNFEIEICASLLFRSVEKMSGSDNSHTALDSLFNVTAVKG